MNDRSTPFDEMSRTFEQMDRMFDRMRRSMYGARRPAMHGDATPAMGGDITPAIEGEGMELRLGSNLSLERNDDGFVVHADLPGFEREEIDLTFDAGMLHVRARHEVTDEHSSRSRTVDERIRVPGEIHVEDISASYRNGVLEITLPSVTPDADAHRIDID